MPEAWYAWLYRFVNALYVARVTVIHKERLPQSGPVLYLGLHRNGAVDGFIYHRVLAQPVFMISTQLRKSWLARLFFQGIAVTRAKDEGDREANDAALRQCLDLLRARGRLLVFPEGTSSLGPRHLPFKNGAAWLVLDYLSAGGPPLQVVPVGIHYECPWAFRSKVEVVLGSPIAIELPHDASRLERLRELKRRLQTALEEVGINVASEECQDRIHRLAYVTTLATPRSYFKSLKALEQSLSPALLTQSQIIEETLRNHRLLLHQGVPLFALGSVTLYVLALVVFAPLVLGAVLVNLPPYLAAWCASRSLPDDRNVISLWKILVGVPLFALWSVAVIVLTALAGKPLLSVLYLLLTWLGLKLYYRVKKLAVAVHNTLRYPELRPQMLAFREAVLNALPHESP